jgi:hypothetical protein
VDRAGGMRGRGEKYVQSLMNREYIEDSIANERIILK